MTTTKSDITEWRHQLRHWTGQDTQLAAWRINCWQNLVISDSNPFTASHFTAAAEATDRRQTVPLRKAPALRCLKSNGTRT